MSQNKVITFKNPGENSEDLLTELLRNGAQRLIAEAVEAEFQRFGIRVIKGSSSTQPPYLRKTKSVEEALPWLYLKGISTGDFQEALQALLGTGAKGVVCSMISR